MIQDAISFFAAHAIETVITVVVGYLLGSINFAILVTDSYSHTDIRKYGSGNAGMTNVMRSVGKKAGFITFFGDFAKGLISVLIGMFLFLMIDSGGAFSQVLDTSLYGSQEWKIGGYIGGTACVLGHIFPLYHEFKGGKGVATAAGMVVATDWRLVLILAAVFFGLFGIFRIISLSSVSIAAAYPITYFLVTYFVDYGKSPEQFTPVYFIITMLLVLIVAASVLLKHKENIKRLINGKEKKFTIKKEA